MWRRGNVEAAGDAGGGVVRDLAVGLCVQTGFGIVARYWGQKGRGNSRMLPLADGAVEGDTGHVPLKRLIKDARDPATFKGGWR